MFEEIIAAGSGGQGVLVLGEVLAMGVIHEGGNATWLPSYGPEMRGGTANCAVVLSNEEIGSPTVDEPSILVCFNQPSFAKFAPAVIPGGLIIANQDAIVDYSGTPDQVRLVKVPGNSIAQELGNDRVINMVMLGALLAQRPLITGESIIAALTEIWGKERAGKLLPPNLKALERGKQAGQPA